MKNDQDENLIVVDTHLRPIDCQWNHDGTVMAIAGRSADASPGPNQNTIQFYTPLGKLIRTMKLPGNNIAGLAWEGFSLRLAFAIDSFIYLAQVKHDYMWTCFSNTLVYHFHKRNKPESYVMFWDTKNNEVFFFFLISLDFLLLPEKNSLWVSCCIALRKTSPSIRWDSVLWRSLRFSYPP